MFSSFSAVAGLFAGSVLLAYLIAAAWYILQVVAYWRIFTKAGRAGWKSIIPIWNVWEQYSLSWEGVYGLLMLALTAVSRLFADSPSTLLSILSGVCSVASAVLYIAGLHKLSRAFGHGVGFTLGLLFLQPVFMLILGFSENKYRGPQ